MVQHKHRDGRGKRAVGEGQPGGVGAQNANAVITRTRLESGSELGVVVQAGDAGNTAPEFGGGGSASGAKLEQVVAELALPDDPGEQLLARDPAPETAAAEPVFKGIHGAQNSVRTAL